MSETHRKMFRRTKIDRKSHADRDRAMMMTRAEIWISFQNCPGDSFAQLQFSARHQIFRRLLQASRYFPVVGKPIGHGGTVPVANLLTSSCGFLSERGI
jgi:hypothetical protein